jgi:hypothetical protein
MTTVALSMRVRKRSPGGAANECGATSVGPDDPTTAYGSGHQGPLTAGAGGKGPAGPLGLSAGKGRRRRPT